MKDRGRASEATTDGGRAEADERRLDDPLLAAAAALFNTLPFSEVTIELAAARAGVDVTAALERYPSAAYLAQGIYQEVLSKIPARLAERELSRFDLHDRLCSIVITEIRMLQPYKGFVRRSILELMNPLSPQLLLQAPLIQRLLAYVADQITVARRVGKVGRWVLPSATAAAFGVLHAKIVTYWLTVDNSDSSTKTLAVIDRNIGTFVRILEDPLGFLSLDAMLPEQAPMPYRTTPLAGSASAAPAPAPTAKRARAKARR